jgi:dienelactone hydrolase
VKSKPARPRLRRLIRVVGVVVSVVVVAVVVIAGGYAGLVGYRHTRPVTLPTPSGAYPVGRAQVQWTDTARTDPLAPVPGRPRVLSVWLWYPAAATGPPAPYAPGAWHGLHFPAPVGWAETRFDAVRTHASAGAAPAAGRFPVVVLEPGLGFAAPQYTALAEDLASHGFLVAGVTPTYSANLSVLDGHAVEATDAGNPRAFDAADLHAPAVTRTADALLAVWATDATFTARTLTTPQTTPQNTPLAAHADPAHVSYVGHSFGGAAALEACRTDPRCDAAVDLDGTQFGPVARLGLDRPFLLVATGTSCIAATCRTPAPADATDEATAQHLITASGDHGRTEVLPGTAHFDITDYGTYYLAAPLRHLLPLGANGGPGLLRDLGDDVSAFLRQPDRARPGAAAPAAGGPWSPVSRPRRR